MDIKIKTQVFLNKFIEQNLNSFILNYKRKHYIISVHHNLPVESVYSITDNKKLNIKVNSCWSEVLIMEPENINLEQYVINSKIKNSLPKLGQTMFIKSNDERFETTMLDIEFIPFDNINNDLTIPYIKSRLNVKIENLSGLSGSPVYIDNSLVGVFSKFDVNESIAYIIPIYIIIKNINKKDNINIYELPIKNRINKINGYNVKDNIIYHKTLKIKIPINTFLILEGDLNVKFLVRYVMTNIIINHMVTRPIKLRISNESYIVTQNLEYKVNPRLLNLLKNFNVNKQIIISLFNHITTSSYPTIFTIKNNQIKLI